MAEAALTPTTPSWPNPAYLGLVWAEMFEKAVTSWTETSSKFALTAIDTASMQAKTFATIGARFKAATPRVTLTLVPPVAKVVEETVVEAAPPAIAEPIVEAVAEPVMAPVAVAPVAAKAPQAKVVALVPATKKPKKKAS